MKSKDIENLSSEERRDEDYLDFEDYDLDDIVLPVDEYLTTTWKFGLSVKN